MGLSRVDSLAFVAAHCVYGARWNLCRLNQIKPLIFHKSTSPEIGVMLLKEA